jgi:hypothetical protein
MPRNGITNKIPLFIPGSTALRASHLNQLVEDANSRRSINAPVQQRPYGKSGGAPVLILTLLEHHNDSLLCEDADANEYAVAKPYELQRTPFDTLTIDGVEYTYTSASEREADDGVATETQFITPNYRVGGQIYAVAIRTDTGAVGPDTPDPVTYLEVNQGRAWAWDGL